MLEDRQKRELAKKKKRSLNDSTDEGLVIVINKKNDFSDSMSDMDEYFVK